MSIDNHLLLAHRKMFRNPEAKDKRTEFVKLVPHRFKQKEGTLQASLNKEQVATFQHTYLDGVNGCSRRPMA